MYNIVRSSIALGDAHLRGCMLSGVCGGFAMGNKWMEHVTGFWKLWVLTVQCFQPKTECSKAKRAIVFVFHLTIVAIDAYDHKPFRVLMTWSGIFSCSRGLNLFRRHPCMVPPFFHKSQSFQEKWDTYPRFQISASTCLFLQHCILMFEKHSTKSFPQ